MRVKLGDVCTVVSGTTPKSSCPEYWDGTINWVTPAELSNDSDVIYESQRKITQKAVAESSLKSFPAGTVLLSSRAPIGKVAIAGVEMYCNQGFKNLICSDAVYNRYLYHYLKSKTEYLNSLGRGATFKEISKSIVENIEIPLPPLDEQCRIATILDKVTDLIAKRQAQLDKLDELVKARFVEMFGNLVTGDKIHYYKRRVGDMASVTKLAGFEFTKYIEYKNHGDIIMLRGLNCKKGRLVLDDIKWIDKTTSDMLPRSKLYNGDILMTYAGTIGDVAMVDEDDKYHLAPNVAKISVTDKEKCNPVFLLHLFMYTNAYIMTFVSQVAQASINMKKIRSFEYYFPDIKLQNTFASFVSSVEKKRVLYTESCRKLKLLKKSLMQNYFI